MINVISQSRLPSISNNGIICFPEGCRRQKLRKNGIKGFSHRVNNNVPQTTNAFIALLTIEQQRSIKFRLWTEINNIFQISDLFNNRKLMKKYYNNTLQKKKRLSFSITLCQWSLKLNIIVKKMLILFTKIIINVLLIKSIHKFYLIKISYYF